MPSLNMLFYYTPNPLKSHGYILLIPFERMYFYEKCRMLAGRHVDTTKPKNKFCTFAHFTPYSTQPAMLHARRSLLRAPGGHPKSPTCGHLKIPHPTVVFKA
jgi:hypothetical protein